MDAFQDRYLTTAAETLDEEDKTKFLEAKKTVEKGTCDDDELHASENVLIHYVNQFGHLILHGDLLSIVMAENAIRFRKQKLTQYLYYDLFIGFLLLVFLVSFH